MQANVTERQSFVGPIPAARPAHTVVAVKPGVARVVDLAVIETLQDQLATYQRRCAELAHENDRLQRRLARVEYEVRVSVSAAVARALEASAC